MVKISRWLIAEEEARLETTRKEYSLDKYSQPTAAQIQEHVQKEERHHQEVQGRAKEQERFERHGKRRIDPLSGFQAPKRIMSPPQMPRAPRASSQVGGARGHDARMAQLMRKRELVSGVPEQQPVVKRRQQQQPRADLHAMEKGLGMGLQKAGPMRAPAGVVAAPAPLQTAPLGSRAISL